MSDRHKTKNQLIAELEQLRAEVVALKQEKKTAPICISKISETADIPEGCRIALSPELGAVYQAINRHPLVVTPDTTIPIVIQQMEQAHSSSVLVIDRGLVVGIFTERDLVKLISERISLDRLTIAEVMTRQLIAISLTELQDAVTVFNLMQEQKIRHLPVLDKSGMMFGLITMKSLRESLQPSDLLRLRRVKEVLVRQVTYAPPDCSLFQIVRLMAQEKISCVVIAETDKTGIILPRGIITERDIVRFHTLELDFYQTQAAMVMSTPLLPISPEDSLLQAYQLMNRHRIRRLVVCDEKGSLLGILTQRSILQAMNPAEAYSVIQILRQEVDRLQNENILLLQTCNRELQRQIKETGAQLAEQIEQERLLAGFTQQINRSLNIPKVLNAKLSCTILLLVTQQSDRTLYQKYLSQDKEYNYTILEFTSPQAALKQCQQMMPDLILVDELLPDMTAQEFLIQLGKLIKRNSLPVIVITESDRTRIIVELLKSGAQDYLKKTHLTATKLHKTIKSVLERIQLSQEQPKQQEQQQLVSITALHIRQFLDLNQILTATVNEVRRIFGCDRVIIYRFKPDFSGIVVVESVVDRSFSMLGWEIKDDCFRKNWVKPYQQGRIRAIEDIYTATDLNQCHVDFLSGFQVRANLVVPILSGENLWGLLIAHNCTAPRHWKATEIDFLSQLATQVGIGIQQAILVTQLQTELKERREAEVALQASEAHFRNAILNAPIPIMLHAEDGEVLLINEVWTEITGYTLAEIPTMMAWINKADRQQRHQFQADIQQLFHSKNRVSQGEYTIKTKTSETRIWNFSSAWLGELADGRRLVISTALDITEQQAALRDRQQAKLQLQESQQRLQLSLEAAKAGSWELNLFTQELISSDQYKANFGVFPKDEITYRQLVEKLIHPHDRAMQQALMRKALEQHIPYEAEYRCSWSDGSIHWLMARGQAYYQDDGTPYRMIGVTLDITDRKLIELELFELTAELEQRVAQRTAELSQANQELLQEINDRKRIETALRESEARWRSLVENAPSFVLMIDREARIIFINRVLPEFSIKTVIGQSFYDYVIPEYQPVQIAAVERVFLSGEPTTFEVLGYKDTQGNLTWYETRLAPIWQDGEISAAIVISNDISDRKQTEADLREKNRRWRSLLDNVQLIVIGLDRQGLVEYVNPFFLKLTGYSETEVVGKSWFDNFVPSTRKLELGRSFQEIIQGVNAHSYFVNPIVTLTGEERIIAWSNTLLHDVQGNAIGSISIGEDITERYKLERMKGEFVSIVSHELRTPLTSMQAALNLLSENIVDPSSETGQSVIQIAAEGVERLVRLVNDILDLERLESGKIRLEKSCCNTAQVVKKAIDQMQELANQSGIKLSTTIESCPIYADCDRLLQVLINLLSNAIKFSANGSTVWLKIEIMQNQLKFSIKDQGRGIPADKLETIFERFHQIDASDSREKGGTGLGLAICRSIVQQHGGEIWVESILGEGSTFYFTLPIGEENCGGN
ncbi:PAS domain S-box protein [Aerosakkonemataceae cyanobacterium BLCC-F50]|uniref:histidine kinase n=1 Tax=Floridaenema flaviceps BLCC-F50 TaxID=3153642 RepID=A0ABV4Y3P2_9CYAN